MNDTLTSSVPLQKVAGFAEVRIQRNHLGLWPHGVREVWQPRG